MSALPFVPALELLTRVVERRNTIPILSNLLLVSDGKSLTMTATDLDIAMTITVACKAPKFETTVEAQQFRDIVKSAGHVEGLRLEKAKLHIGSGPSFTLETLPADDFPRMSPIDQTIAFELPVGRLLADLNAVAPAICTEETRYYLNGINMETRDGQLCFMATDGHRLHILQRECPPGAEGLVESILPRKSVRIIQATLEMMPSAIVKLGFGRLKSQFSVGEVTIKTKLIDGTYPDVRRVIPTAARGTLRAPAGDLLAVVKAAQLVGSDKNRFVKLDFGNGLVSADSVGGAKMTAAMPGVQDGELPSTIGFNTFYLAAACERFNGDEITLSFTDSTSPTMVTAQDSPLRTILMPARL